METREDYEALEVEVISFEPVDIITASNETPEISI